MKIITLQGSARKKGNTAAVLGWVEDQLKTMGHTVEPVYLNSKEINGCLGCAKCKEQPDMVGCIRNDDAPAILEKMIDAQVTIFASPLYFWGFTAQIKALIDRSYSLVTNYHQPGHTSLVENRRMALLVTGGGEYKNNAEPVFTAFDRIIGFYKAQKAGQLFIGPCTTADQLKTSFKDQAISFAREIVS